ncbi:hypothetical protein SSGZ1_1526 [Streptococcus suis GZ1]|uniref:Uncharacterized protein n=1 Tax=Streptococcus suis (strain GZ1) TaxID=423211 RepID=D5AJG7_STRGZ|nr:hypothetical protein SSGZ1_1526 [Streptococcus suis GZ1]
MEEQAKGLHFVFSHPDLTVGCGIAPHQLSLADYQRSILF